MTGKMDLYSHLLKSFPQFVMIRTVKDFSVVDETEVDAFLEFHCFLLDTVNVSIWISDSSALSKPNLDIGKFLVGLMVKPSMQNFNLTLPAWQISTIVQWFKHSLVLPFLEIGMRIDLFPFCGHFWVFQVC